MINKLDQILLFTASNMKARYRGTFAGFVWVVINPMILFAAQSLVFKHILKLDVPNYALFLLGGLLPWLFITQTFDMCIPVLQSSSELLRAYKINPKTLVWSQILDNFLNFLFAFFFILVPTILITGEYTIGYFFIPIALINLIIGVGSAVWLLSVMQVFYRDTKFIVQFLVSVLFFLTPIFYPIELIPKGYQWLVTINPFYRFIEPFRICLYDFKGQAFFVSCILSFSLTGLLILLSSHFWRKKKNDFYMFL